MAYDFVTVDTVFLNRIYMLMDLDQRTDKLRFLLRDRDAKFTAAFDTVFTTPPNPQRIDQ